MVGGSGGHGGSGSAGFDAVALVALLDADLAELSDGEVTAGLVGLIDLAGRLDATMARLAAAFDTRLLHAFDGARNAAGWLAARTEVSRGRGWGLVHNGRDLRHCPHVDAAAADGRLGSAKVQALLEVRREVEARFGVDEEMLVGLVAPLTVADARHVLARWRLYALAEAGRDDGAEPHADAGRNGFTLSPTLGDRWAAQGDFDTVTGAGIAGALDAWIDARIAAGVLDPTARSRASLRAEALAALVGAGDLAEPGAHQGRARVAITWDAADLLGHPVVDLADLARRRRATDSGVTLAYEVAAMALCNAEIVNLLTVFGLNKPDTVLGVTHTRRYPTDHERHALAQRDRGCVFPGCDAPVRWCHAHHTIDYELGHRTRLDELVLLCPHHHRIVHRPGWALTRSPTGAIYVTRPDHTLLAGRDHPPPGHKLPPRSNPPPGRQPAFDPVTEARRDTDAQRARDDDLTRHWQPPHQPQADTSRRDTPRPDTPRPDTPRTDGGHPERDDPDTPHRQAG